LGIVAAVVVGFIMAPTTSAIDCNSGLLLAVDIVFVVDIDVAVF